MPLPADWTVNDQNRSSRIDRELISSLQAVFRAVNQAKSVKLRFQALSMHTRWPSALSDYVHQGDDAQTRQEQTDAGNLIDYLRAKLLNDGTPATITDAQAAALLARYAG